VVFFFGPLANAAKVCVMLRLRVRVNSGVFDYTLNYKNCATGIWLGVGLG